MARRPSTAPRPAPRAPSYQDDMKALQDLLVRAPAARRIEMHIEDLAARWLETLGADTASERIEQLRADLGDGVEAAREAALEVDPGLKADTRNAQAALDAVTCAKASADALSAPGA